MTTLFVPIEQQQQTTQRQVIRTYANIPPDLLSGLAINHFHEARYADSNVVILINQAVEPQMGLYLMPTDIHTPLLRVWGIASEHTDDLIGYLFQIADCDLVLSSTHFVVRTLSMNRQYSIDDCLESGDVELTKCESFYIMRLENGATSVMLKQGEGAWV